MLSTRLRSLLLGFALCATACPTTPAGMDAAPPNDASDDTAAAEAGLDMGVPDASPPWLAPYTPTMRAPLPANFFWGSSTAAYQIEGGLGNTDWGTWERMGRIANNDRADDGPQSLTRYMDDLRTLTETGQNAYRFGIEWARLFPTQAAWETCRAARSMTDLAARHRVCRAAASAAGIAYYDSVLAAARAAGLTPLVTLQHFTFPNYMNDLTQDWHTQGWLRPGLPDELALWASFVAREWGDRVDWYVTINEPLVTATVGYLDGRTPPGQRFQLDAILQVVTAQIRSHAAMFDALHAGDTTAAPVMNRSPVSPAPAAMVSIAHHVRRFFPRSAGRNDTNAARNAEYLFNRLFVEAVARGNLDSDGDGTPETMNDPALRNRLDYLGINYYSLTVVDGGAGVPLLGGLPEDDAIQRGLPKNDLGWDIYPRGMEDELLWAATYNLPILVTENGIADRMDVNRPRYLLEHLAAMQSAMAQGARVLGYFHWSNIDNFEWVSGYCPSFGFYSVDRTSPQRTRTARPSAMTYRNVIQAGGVTDAMLAGLMPYRSATTFCVQGTTPDGGM